jgi:CRP-like cAMP-binding protein
MFSVYIHELSQTPFFRGLDEMQLASLDSYVELCHFTKDQVIFSQGQIADYVYILRLGEVIIQYKPYDAPLLIVTRIEPSVVFGWSAALGRIKYTSTAIAAVDSEAYQIQSEGLSRTCDQYPETGVVLLGRLAGIVAERLPGTYIKIGSTLSQELHREDETRNNEYGKK